VTSFFNLRLEKIYKRMKLPTALLVVLTLAYPISPAVADGLNPGWDYHVHLGYEAEMRGDYDSAIIQYEKARQAAAEMPNRHYGQGGIFGAESRIAGARAAKEFLKTYGRNSTTFVQAHDIAGDAFRQLADELFVGEYESSCP
jgi:hypothetical protein